MLGTKIDIRNYSGPLDLLNSLLEERELPLEAIPLGDICEQYLNILRANVGQTIDLDMASEFILLAATLINIKMRLLLPNEAKAEPEAELDAREELVLKLLAYRRIKNLALELSQRAALYSKVFFRNPASASSLGLTQLRVESMPELDKLGLAIASVVARNQERFSERAQKFRQLLRRERFTVKDKMQEILLYLSKQKRLVFNEIFPAQNKPLAERISAFLAVLELLRENRISVWQKQAFAPITIEASANYQEEQQ